jgi:hypothetical protein
MTPWAGLVDHWDRAPARLRTRGRHAPISPDDAYRAAALASRPFRHGSRLRAVPDVRFYIGSEQVRAPGDLLPGPDDSSLAAYLRRASRAVSPHGFQLVIEQPLAIDDAIWRQARDLVRDLFDRVGYPTLPLQVELILGHFACSPRGVSKPLDRAALTIPLVGDWRSRLWRSLPPGSPSEHLPDDLGRPTCELAAAAGDVLYWPSAYWHVDAPPGAAMALRLWIPAPGCRTSAPVRDAVTALMTDALVAGDVPYLAFPPARNAIAAPPMLRAARALTAVVRGPALMRALRIEWARRVSACGLQPVPDPDRRELADSDRVRFDPRQPIIQMPGPDGEVIWAVNGHAFAVREHGHRALTRLMTLLAREASVEEICGSDTSLRAALELLVEIRALRVRSA